jgi:hypothetical protein
MKGLAHLPNKKDFVRGANALQTRQVVSTKNLILYSQWARVDARFAQIVVTYLFEHWKKLSLHDVLSELESVPWPRALVVLLRFVDLQISDRERSTLQHFILKLEAALPPMPPQLFFVPLQKWPAVVLQTEVDLRTFPYTKSGFIGSQSLLSRAQWPKNKTFIGPVQRRSILQNLFKNKKIVTVAEYLAACRGLVSRRQAQRDLAEFAQPKGFTRNRRYALNSK